jgi:hypothetical protein
MALRLQKFVPVDRDYPIIEIVDQSGEVLFDVSRNDAGVLEMAFHPAIAKRVFVYDDFVSLVEQAKLRAVQED